MRIIIAGSRTFTDYELVKTSIRKIYPHTAIAIISGCARGADQLGERFAAENNLPVFKYPAEWDKYGKSAGYKRNETMAQNAHALIAFWDGKSKGTEHMINLAKKYNLLVDVVNF